MRAWGTRKRHLLARQHCPSSLPVDGDVEGSEVLIAKPLLQVFDDQGALWRRGGRHLIHRTSSSRGAQQVTQYTGSAGYRRTSANLSKMKRTSRSTGQRGATSTAEAWGVLVRLADGRQNYLCPGSGQLVPRAIRGTVGLHEKHKPNGSPPRSKPSRLPSPWKPTQRPRSTSS
jgi:hypothetical protein